MTNLFTREKCRIKHTEGALLKKPAKLHKDDWKQASQHIALNHWILQGGGSNCHQQRVLVIGDDAPKLMMQVHCDLSAWLCKSPFFNRAKFMKIHITSNSIILAMSALRNSTLWYINSHSQHHYSWHTLGPLLTVNSWFHCKLYVKALNDTSGSKWLITNASLYL